MRVAEEIVRRLRRAADAGELCDLVRLDVGFPAGLDNRRGNRIVSAARAQRRNAAFVIAARMADFVLRQVGMMQFRFGEIGHDTTFLSGTTVRAAACCEIWSTMK